MPRHPELQTEQAYADHARECLEQTRAALADVLEDAYAAGGVGTPQAVTERDVSVRQALGRLEQLHVGEESLVFGRIDTAAWAQPTPDAGGVGGAGEAGARGEAFHIGRLAVSGPDQEPLVVDWRAPIAEPFYRATGAHPMGLARRRHFLAQGRQITDIEDELFGDGGPDGGLGVGGSTVLLKALERSRSGRMRDIVATVQREQDEVIRAPMAGVLVVQGGPGTGKTAVALHRAAYLLYTHRFPLERQGVLVVGPNPLFLRYIEHVLPSLGETGVELSTIGGLARTRASAADGPATARVKGHPRMADVVAKAIADRERGLTRDLDIGIGSFRVRITAGDTRDIVAQARRRPTPHNTKRRTVEALLARRVASRLDALRERARETGLRSIGVEALANGRRPATGGRTPGGNDGGDADLARELRAMPAVAEALDRMWPVLTAEELLHDLFGAAPLVDLAAGRWFSPQERSLLHRRRSESLEAIRWTDEDLPLLDEARALLGPVPKRRTTLGTEIDDPGDVRTFGHIVVDEAQDLTPMQLRMLARRSLNGSMTIVGDVAQATGAFAPRSWADQLAHLPVRGSREVELSVNYRTPAEIMTLAARVLAEAAPWLKPSESVRAGDADPRVVRAQPGLRGATLADAVRFERSAIGEGTIAVLAPPSLVVEAMAALQAAGLDPAVAGSNGALDAPITVLPVGLAKGLEFDAVVVVEPAIVVGESPQGLRALYVALTRPTRRLAIVHELQLPACLAPQAAPTLFD